MVHVEFEGLTAVIQRVPNSIEFESELERLEQEHQLVTWSDKYIVKPLANPPVRKCCYTSY